MTNAEKRMQIAQQTLYFLSDGKYPNRHGETIEIAEQQAYAVENSVYYTSEQLASLQQSVRPPQGYTTRFEVTGETTLAAAKRLVESGIDDPLCLNFASAKNPGGGFLRGTEAQEENLAKSSGLYPCLVQMSAMYQGNRQRGTCLYSDDMIYAPKVPVFRDDNYGLLDQHYLASMVTSPAVNLGALTNNEPERLPEVEGVMLTRIDKLLTLALHHGHEHLVLGAWGCGVFGNDPTQMAQWFAKHLLHNERYRHAFASVTFAVLDTRNNGTLAAFQSEFQ